MGSCVIFLIHGTILQQRIPLLQNRVRAEKKDRLTWLLNNRASDCWKILPTTIEESCKRIQKHKMDVWYNVNIASAIDFQIICYYVQYQFLKVLPSVLMKTGTGWGVPEALLTQPLFLQLFNMWKMPLQEI